MKVYKFKCDSCGSKKYIKTEDGYKCEYCGSIQDVIIQSEPEVKSIDESDNIKDSHEPMQFNVEQKSLLIRLIMCIVVGYFGVHKFMEGKIFLGIAYIFTGGLFGIGLLVDVINYISMLCKENKTDGDVE